MGFSRRHRDGIQQTRWYYTTQTYQGTPVTLDYLELIITGRTMCTVYLWNQGD